MIVAVHQPNYLPWLGYFAKMARADVFVFLDDVQFSKGSYTNRVQIARAGAPAWLTVPIRHRFGAPISEIAIAKDDFGRAHLDTLKQSYRSAKAFDETWPAVEAWLSQAQGNLATFNRKLIGAVAERLGLAARLVSSSELAVKEQEADRRLAAIVGLIAPGGTYLSGSGGAKYQGENAFSAAGVRLAYSDYRPARYERSGESFIAGLSILDAAFHLGFEQTATIVRPS